MKTSITKLALTATLMASLVMALPALAAKPASNTNGAQTYAWHLSGAVMPTPPYGGFDITGSDTGSKLIVNQPSGKVSAMVTGLMNGLQPNTTYTIYLSNGYTPYKAGDISGTYTIHVTYLGNPFYYTLTLAQSGTTLSGNLNDPYLPGDLPVTGTTNGSNFSFSVTYPTNYQGTRTFTGTIGGAGALSGTWTETGTEQGSDVWSTTSGQAKSLPTGNTSWTGLLANTSPFTFTTDNAGSGSWHYNFVGAAASPFSVWVNAAGGTILISDSINLN